MQRVLFNDIVCREYEDGVGAHCVDAEEQIEYNDDYGLLVYLLGHEGMLYIGAERDVDQVSKCNIHQY